MLALLILNLEQSGKYTPFPRESHRSAAELILCVHSSGTWSFHSFFFFFHFFFFTFSSWMTATRNAKKKKKKVECVCECEWGDWGSRVCDQWRLILCVCVFWELAISTAHCLLLYQSTLCTHTLSLSVCALERELSLQHRHTLVSSQ